MSDAEARKVLDEIAGKLGEHFDAAQILATWVDQDGTHSLPVGFGNWYSRQGLAHEFINADIAQDQARQIAEQLKEDE